MFIAGLLWADEAKPVFPVGTHVYVGTAYDYAGYLVQPEANMTVQALGTNGNVLAAAPIVKAEGLGRNFLLSVPITNPGTDKSAAIGDRVVLVVKQGERTLYASDASRQTVSGANMATEVRFVMATDSDGDGVPDEYVNYLAPFLEAYGISPSGYDAWADYDGDGQSNYAEYVAGTDPFDEYDFLRITDFKAAGNDNVALSFEYVGSRVYLIQSSSKLGEGARWTTDEKFLGDTSHDIGTATLYFKPVTPSRFYRILVQEPDKE